MKKNKWCEIGQHEVPMLWKANPRACRDCWGRHKYAPAKPHPEAYKRRHRQLGVWFADQILQLPNSCEECGDYLNRNAPWGARAYVAHILPKRTFESVMLHPMNRVFLCIRCHTNLDNWGSDKVRMMKVYPVLVERFKQFRDSVTETATLPAHLQDLD